MPEYAAVNKPLKHRPRADVITNTTTTDDVTATSDDEYDYATRCDLKEASTTQQDPETKPLHSRRPSNDLDIPSNDLDIEMTENDVYERGDDDGDVTATGDVINDDVYCLEQPVATTDADTVNSEEVQMQDNDVYES